MSLSRGSGQAAASLPSMRLPTDGGASLVEGGVEPDAIPDEPAADSSTLLDAEAEAAAEAAMPVGSLLDEDADACPPAGADGGANPAAGASTAVGVPALPPPSAVTVEDLCYSLQVCLSKRQDRWHLQGDLSPSPVSPLPTGNPLCDACRDHGACDGPCHGEDAAAAVGRSRARRSPHIHLASLPSAPRC